MSDSRVYVGGLPNDIEERDLEKFFDGYGRINEIMIRRGLAFVQFDDRRDAEDAIYYLNKKQLLGRRVTVEKARGKPKGRNQWPSSRKIDSPRRPYGAPVRTEFKLVVKNLSSKVSWQDLKDYMREAGEVTNGDAHRPYKNEGVVEFATYADMKAAIRKFDGALFKGEKIRLIDAMKSGRDRYDHSRTRSRSRSRALSISRSRSRNRSRSCCRSSSRSRARNTSRPISSSRSRSRGRARTTSRSSSRSRARNTNRPRSRSRSCSRGTVRTTSRSSSRSRARNPSRPRSRSRSRSRGTVRTTSRSTSRSRARNPSRPRSRSSSRSRGTVRTTSRSSSRGRNGQRTTRSSRSRPRSKCAVMNRKYFKSRSESNSSHRKSQTTNSGPKTPPAGLEPHGRSDSPRNKYEYRSRSNSHEDRDARVDHQCSRPRSSSRSNSPDSRNRSPNKSRKLSRFTSPSEIPAKRLKKSVIA